jgi:nicotinamide-nucleotide amidase
MSTAHLINIGDEILIGQIVNTNATWMATQLNLHGIFVEKIISISDDREAITQAISLSISQTDIILITGGLGPTKDDITKKTLADFFGLALVYHAPSFENIQRLFAEFGRVADERYQRQCDMPQGAEILINLMGTASGMWFNHKGKVVVSMPGVPREMQYLMTAEVLPRLQKTFTLPAIAHKTILTTGKGETDLSGILSDWEDALPAHIRLAYLPDTMGGKVRLRLTARGQVLSQLQAEVEEQAAKLPALLGSLIFGYEDDSLEKVVGELLLAKGWRMATAESCTGGNIAQKISSIPGASRYYEGSIVAYSNAIKQNILGVPAQILDTEGAVSEATVKAMLQGLLQTLQADCGIAISGIAGPDGGRPDKPVGTIWLAIGSREQIITKKLQLGKDRARNIELSSNYALNFLRLFLLGELS